LLLAFPYGTIPIRGTTEIKHPSLKLDILDHPLNVGFVN